jgi:hypothetical protein
MALGAIIDLHVELGSPALIVKHQDLALMNIVIFSEAVLATSKESIAIAIIIHLQFIWWPATGSLTKNNFSKFTALHELCELHKKALMFALMGTSKRKEGKYIAR